VEQKQYQKITPILSAFKDGVADALNVGVRNFRVDIYESNLNHFYNQGYDFGITLYSQQIDKE
tara:strand:+ start:673 stop:861 length:189 start_codon:yes stop_codon:yes gene_type:complete